QNTIEEKAHIRNAAGHHILHKRSFSFRAFALHVAQMRRAYFRVIERGNDISMAAQVRTQKSGCEPVASRVMREDDRRIISLTSRSVAMLSRSRVPDLARERAIPRRIQSLDVPHSHRKRTSDKRIVSAHVAILYRHVFLPVRVRYRG